MISNKEVALGNRNSQRVKEFDSPVFGCKVSISGTLGVPLIFPYKLLQILRIPAENKPYHHIVHDPLDRRVVVGEDGCGFVTRFQISKCDLHGADKQWMNCRVLRKNKKICRKILRLGWLFGGEDHRVE